MTHANSPSYSSQYLKATPPAPDSKARYSKEMRSHHRYVGNHLITWLRNRFYKVGVSDSQYGFRAFTRQALEKLKPEVSGIEFVTNMFTKAPHTGLGTAEPTITYYPQVDGAPSKLESLRDSWRCVKHLTYSPGIHDSIKGGNNIHKITLILSLC
jgi:hypothetical protein